MPQINIKINRKTWEITLDAEGYSGISCVDDLIKIQTALGLKDAHIIPKAEMFYTETDKQKVISKEKEEVKWRR